MGPGPVVFAGILLFASAVGSDGSAGPSTNVVIPVPYRSQFTTVKEDKTPWDVANCGPASVGMVLELFGQQVKTSEIRQKANKFMGLKEIEPRKDGEEDGDRGSASNRGARHADVIIDESTRDVAAGGFDSRKRDGEDEKESEYTIDDVEGTSLESLAAVIKEYKLDPVGMYDRTGWHRWTLEEIVSELDRGHPLIVQVRYRLLPAYKNSTTSYDHYLVITGMEGGDLLINDSAAPWNKGLRSRLTWDELETAWSASGVPMGGFAIGEKP